MKKTHVLLGIALVTGAVVTGFIGNYAGLTKDSWPGWVQAIGSIAALGVAIFVMGRQNQHAAALLIDADKRALLRRAGAVGAILDRANLQVPQVCQLISTSIASNNVRYIRANMSAAKLVLYEAQSAIRAIPAHELGSYAMVSGLYKTLEVLITFDSAIETWLEGMQLPPIATITEFMRVATNGCAEANEIYLRGVAQLTSE